ncbi:MAG: hypothetical protein IT447_05410 [Phycisphaerales bacterium]|jgi:hypothetical protein|nr:hypothetical protein [Phycisphaerales bacterium]
MKVKTIGVGVMSVALGIFLLMGIGGCKSERESAASNFISLIDEIADRLSQIKSNTDLVDAKGDLEKLGARMKDQMKVMEKLGTPTGDEKKALEAEYKSKMEKATDRLQDELKRLAKDVSDSAPMEVMAMLNINPMEMRGMDME